MRYVENSLTSSIDSKMPKSRRKLMKRIPAEYAIKSISRMLKSSV